MCNISYSDKTPLSIFYMMVIIRRKGLREAFLLIIISFFAIDILGGNVKFFM